MEARLAVLVLSEVGDGVLAVWVVEEVVMPMMGVEVVAAILEEGVVQVGQIVLGPVEVEGHRTSRP